MYGWKKRLLSCLSAMIMAAAPFLAGCGNGTDNTLVIRYYEGGFGSEWLVNALEAFGEGRENFSYRLIPDANITWQAGMYLRGNDQPDIIMSQGGNWRDYVARGYLEPLTEVYEAEVTTSDGVKTVEEFLLPEAREKFSMQRLYGQGETMPYAMPWSVLPCSLIYNETMLLQTVHTDSGYTVSDLNVGDTWERTPATVTELRAYFADIEAANSVRPADDRVAPFGWSGDAVNWFSFALNIWWAQTQGLETPYLAGEGSYYDFWNFADAEVYRQTGIQTALGTLQSLIVKDGEFCNSVQDPMSKVTRDVELEFAGGKVAVMLCGSFFEYEMKDFLDNDGDGEPDFVYKMMLVPSLDTADSSDTDMLYTTMADVMFIPAGADNKSLAKEFLIFLSSEEQVMAFSRTTGSMRPFDYNPLELDPGYAWTTFNRSVLELYFDSVVISEYPKTAESISPLYIYKSPTTFSGVDGTTIIYRLRTLTPRQIMIDGAEGYRSVYDMAVEQFATWAIELGL